MAKQTYADVIRTPPLADLTAIVATAETGLWLPAAFTPIYANDPEIGKIYEVVAGGIMSTAASGTLTITPRYGLTTGGVSLGASVAQTVPVSVTNQPWQLRFTLVFRAISSAASSSTCVGTGSLQGPGTAATAGSGLDVVFGGTVITTADTTTNQGIFIGWTLSVAGSCTPRYAFIRSFN